MGFHYEHEPAFQTFCSAFCSGLSVMFPSEDNAVLYRRPGSYTAVIIGMEVDYMLQ